MPELRSLMSRVQLALNVSNIDEAIAFYSKMFNTASADVYCATAPSESVNLTSKTGCC
jgi:predicted enzyme related to lactoylglutathione lyase